MRLIGILVLVFNLLGGGGQSFATEALPAKVVGDFHTVLRGVMKQSSLLKTAMRYQKLAPAIDAAFKLDFMIRVAAGTAWRKASDADKKRLTQAFRRLSIATYAARFNGYSGQRFETLKTTEGPRKMQLVHTRIVNPQNQTGDQSIKLTYVTKKFQAGWRIVDILLAGGISELAVKHSEYRATLITKGAGGLARILDKKADQLIAE